VELDLGQPKLSYNSNIKEVEIPPEMEHAVPTGHPYLDLLFAGDGIVPSTSVLVTGLPSAGKSTLMRQLANSITGTGNFAVYNIGEESLYQVSRHVKQLGLVHGFIPGYNRCVDDIIEHLELVKKDNPNKQIFFIQDSIPCLEPSKFDPETGEKLKGRPKTGLNAELEAVSQLVAWGKKNFGIMIFIGQVTKEGVFAGLNKLKHLVDCHLHLGIDTNRKSDTYGERVAEMEKNRFGVSGQIFGFEINNLGVSFDVKTENEKEEVPAAEESEYTIKDSSLDNSLDEALSAFKLTG
jgi:DNA repair protein RadA/Sms